MGMIEGRSGKTMLAGAALVAGSLALLAVSIFVVVTSLQGDNVELPEEGSLAELLDTGPKDPTRLTGFEVGRGYGERQGSPPVQLAIPQLRIDAPVVTMGLDADRIPMVPESGEQVAWYDFSATPGKHRNAVFSGHVDWQTGSGAPIPGVFYRLRELRIGDDILVTLEDGKTLTYRVVGNVATDYDDPNVLRAMDEVIGDVITLITCGGSWLNDPSSDHGGVYSHRVVVRAELVPRWIGG